MNLFFGTQHIETLVDLKNIVEKHGAKIKFGFSSFTTSDFYSHFLKKELVDGKVIDYLENNLSYLREINYTQDKVWFEVYEESTEKYHTMSHIQESQSFIIDRYAVGRHLIYEDEMDEEVRGLISDFTENNEYEDFFSYSGDFTIITGFGNEKKIEDNRVYRPDMALKFFGDLVCDYFNEPRIERVY